MDFPPFLGPNIEIGLRSPLEGLGGGAAPEGEVLEFVMQPQQQSEWCWAATSVSVSHFYSETSTWSQCLVANEELGRSDCCTNGGNCNEPWYLNRALARTRNFVSFGGAGNFEDVCREVKAGHPLGCRIEWQGGSGHFLVLAGWRSAGGVNYV